MGTRLFSPWLCLRPSQTSSQTSSSLGAFKTRQDRRKWCHLSQSMGVLSLLRILAYATTGVLSVVATIDVADQYLDPCAIIGGKKWVSPQDVRACFTSVKVDQSVKENVHFFFLECVGCHGLPVLAHRSLKSSIKLWPFILPWITKSEPQSRFQRMFTKIYWRTWLGFNNGVILRISIFISTFLLLWNA